MARSTVEIYKRVREGPGKGMRVGTAAARHVDTKAKVMFMSGQVGREASSILARHHYEGDAFIQVQPGSAAEGSKPKYADIERVIVLNDTRGFGAAMTIEFGMGPGIDEFGNFYPGTEAVAPLRRSAGLKWERRRRGAPTPRKYNPYSRKIFTGFFRARG